MLPSTGPSSWTWPPAASLRKRPTFSSPAPAARVKATWLRPWDTAPSVAAMDAFWNWQVDQDIPVGLPSTLTVKTGGQGERYHFYFLYPDDGQRYGCRSVKGVFDIRGMLQEKVTLELDHLRFKKVGSATVVGEIQYVEMALNNLNGTANSMKELKDEIIKLYAANNNGKPISENTAGSYIKKAVDAGNVKASPVPNSNSKMYTF